MKLEGLLTTLQVTKSLKTIHGLKAIDLNGDLFKILKLIFKFFLLLNK